MTVALLWLKPWTTLPASENAFPRTLFIPDTLANALILTARTLAASATHWRHWKTAMSSSPSREPLTGIIRQDANVVGAVCLPDEELQEFIEQFNHCYGSIGMRIEAPPGAVPTITGPTRVLPVGATFRQPLKPPKP